MNTDYLLVLCIIVQYENSDITLAELQKELADYMFPEWFLSDPKQETLMSALLDSYTAIEMHRADHRITKIKATKAAKTKQLEIRNNLIRAEAERLNQPNWSASQLADKLAASWEELTPALAFLRPLKSRTIRRILK